MNACVWIGYCCFSCFVRAPDAYSLVYVSIFVCAHFFFPFAEYISIRGDLIVFVTYKLTFELIPYSQYDPGRVYTCIGVIVRISLMVFQFFALNIFLHAAEIGSSQCNCNHDCSIKYRFSLTGCVLVHGTHCTSCELTVDAYVSATLRTDADALFCLVSLTLHTMNERTQDQFVVIIKLRHELRICFVPVPINRFQCLVRGSYCRISNAGHFAINASKTQISSFNTTII